MQRHVWWDAMEIGLEHVVELVIVSKLATNGSIVEYQDKVFGFSQKEGVDFDQTLALVIRGFSQKEGAHLV